VQAQDMQRLYQAEDFTAMNIFSNNIEGPAFDKDGNLYVVNFERDGTIGVIRPDGKAELFVVLSEGSTANSIQFNRRGDMFLADFTGHNVLRVDMKTKKVSVFAHNGRFNQPNDLSIDSKVRLFA